jgi:hypothetical protein
MRSLAGVRRSEIPLLQLNVAENQVNIATTPNDHFIAAWAHARDGKLRALPRE